MTPLIGNGPEVFWAERGSFFHKTQTSIGKRGIRTSPFSPCSMLGLINLMHVVAIALIKIHVGVGGGFSLFAKGNGIGWFGNMGHAHANWPMPLFVDIKLLFAELYRKEIIKPIDQETMVCKKSICRALHDGIHLIIGLECRNPILMPGDAGVN